MEMKELREWEELKDEVVELFEGRLRVLRVGHYEDDGITLLPLDDEGWGVPLLTLERRVLDCGLASICLSICDRRRDVFNVLPLTGMCETQARMAVEFAVSCLFGIDADEPRLSEEA